MATLRKVKRKAELLADFTALELSFSLRIISSRKPKNLAKEGINKSSNKVLHHHGNFCFAQLQNLDSPVRGFLMIHTMISMKTSRKPQKKTFPVQL